MQPHCNTGHAQKKSANVRSARDVVVALIMELGHVTAQSFPSPDAGARVFPVGSCWASAESCLARQESAHAAAVHWCNTDRHADAIVKCCNQRQVKARLVRTAQSRKAAHVDTVRRLALRGALPIYEFGNGQSVASEKAGSVHARHCITGTPHAMSMAPASNVPSVYCGARLSFSRWYCTRLPG